MSPTRLLGTYLQLVRASQQRNRPLVASRLLVLGGVVAARMQLEYIPAYCRLLVLQDNPHHLLARFETIEEALTDSDFLHLLKQLQRRYPLERAEQLLQQLQIELPDETPHVVSDEYYAAEVLGTTLLEVKRALGVEA